MTTLSTLTLAKLDALGTFQNEPRTLHVEHAGATLTCRLESADALSCAFMQLQVAATSRERAADEQRSARRLCERLTYLLEPLDLIETDPASRRVLLRSHPPQRDASARTYYELVVDAGGEATVRRFRKTRETGRAATVACLLTKEALAKLIDDLVESVS